MPPAYEILLLNTAVPQIQAAQSGDTYVVPRDIAFSAALTLSAGTANGVPYLNGSKVLTTGSALTFDGTNLNFDVNGATIYWTAAGNNVAINTSSGTLGFYTGTSSYGLSQQINADGTTFWKVTGSEQMRLTSTGLGIGTSSPGGKLDVKQTTDTSLGGIYVRATDSNAAVISRLTTGNLVVRNGGIDSIFLDSSGNLGLGVTPSSQRSGYVGLQVGQGSVILSNKTGTGTNLIENAYLGASNYQYIATGYASEYTQYQGQHQWYTAPSGTAGNPITFTQAMTLDASGNLSVGTTSAATIKVTSSAGGVDGAVSYAGAFHANKGTSGDAWIQLGGNRSDGLGSGRVAYVDARGVSGTGTLGFSTEGTERARITSGGDFQTSSGNSVMVGGTAARATTAGTNRVDIFDGTAPVGTLANGISLYSSSGEAYVMDAAGNATLFSPHDAETNEWIFRSKHTPTGKVLKIDVERLLKFVNDHFGLDAVHEFIED